MRGCRGRVGTDAIVPFNTADNESDGQGVRGAPTTLTMMGGANSSRGGVDRGLAAFSYPPPLGHAAALSRGEGRMKEKMRRTGEAPFWGSQKMNTCDGIFEVHQFLHRLYVLPIRLPVPRQSPSPPTSNRSPLFERTSPPRVSLFLSSPCHRAERAGRGGPCNSCYIHPPRLHSRSRLRGEQVFRESRVSLCHHIG